jgi:uncharacterized protein (TIGR03437 family)
MRRSPFIQKSSGLGRVSFLAALVFAAMPAFGQLYVTSTIGGTGTIAGYSGDGGPIHGAQFSGPLIITFDSQGNYYIADSQNRVIRKVDTTGTITTVAGTGTFGYSGDGGPATSANLSLVEGLVVDPKGNIYIADTANARVRVVDPSGNINTYAGSGTRGYSGDYGAATSASLFLPAGLALDGAGNLYIADYGNSTVRKVSTSGQITTVAGLGLAGFATYLGSEGGPATHAVLGLPYAVTVDETGNLFIADIGSGSIREVTKDGIIHTAVKGVASGSVIADPAGNVYYADFNSNTISKLAPNGTTTMLFGNGYRGYYGDGGSSAFSEFNAAYSIALDPHGNFYVADFTNDVIRLISPLPASTLLIANGASNIAWNANASGLSSSQQAIAPGEVVTLSGANLGPASISQAQADANNIYEAQLNGTTVTFNGVPAPILSAGPQQIVAIVPYEIAGLSQVPVKVFYQGKQMLSATAPVTDSEPEIFTAGSSAINSLWIANSDGSQNRQANAAAETSTITLFVTGEGQTSPSGVDGQVTVSGSEPKPLDNVSVFINGTAATVTSAAEADNLPAGILQISVTLPSSVTTNKAASIYVQIGNNTSLATTLAVQ